MSARLHSTPQHDFSESTSCDDTPEARRKAAQNFASELRDMVEFEDFVRSVLFQFTPIHNQNRQCLAAAHFVGVDVETVRRWSHGMTSPKAKDFWPLAITAILQGLPIETQQEVMQSITGMMGGEG